VAAGYNHGLAVRATRTLGDTTVKGTLTLGGMTRTNWLEYDPNFAAWTNGLTINAGMGASGIKAVSLGFHANGNQDGIALGENTSATNGGVAIGTSVRANNKSVSIGYHSQSTFSSSDTNNVALGAFANVPIGMSDTAEIGAGTAVLNGWLHYRGYPIIGPSGQFVAGNPSYATNWLWTNMVTYVVLTNYNGPSDVVIPDYLDGLPVTEMTWSFSSSNITSVIGGNNLQSIEPQTFFGCDVLVTVSLPALRNVGNYTFKYCSSLQTLLLPSVTNVDEDGVSVCPALMNIDFSNLKTAGNNAFSGTFAPSTFELSFPNLTSMNGAGALCFNSGAKTAYLPKYVDVKAYEFAHSYYLTEVTLSSVTNMSDGVLYDCALLNRVNFYGDAPSVKMDGLSPVYTDSPNVTNYVLNPIAQGWSNSLAGRPVVRPPIYAESMTSIGDGRSVWGVGFSITNIAVNAYGASQHGYNQLDPYVTVVTTIGNNSYGAHQFIWNDNGYATIGTSSAGAGQYGYMNSGGYMTIGNSSYGACQRGIVNWKGLIGNDAAGSMQCGEMDVVSSIDNNSVGAMQMGFFGLDGDSHTGNYGNFTNSIGIYSHGASQFGYFEATDDTTNSVVTIGNRAYGASQHGHTYGGTVLNQGAAGALQLFDLTSGQTSKVTSAGAASFVLGAGTASNKNSIVAGDGQESHGDGSITAVSVVWASSLVLTNLPTVTNGLPVGAVYRAGSNLFIMTP
jgi:hypothetical protein